MSESISPEQVPRVPLPEAKRRFDAGSSLFVDVRSVEDYRRGHIPGALSIPFADTPERLLQLSRDRDIILY